MTGLHFKTYGDVCGNDEGADHHWKIFGIVPQFEHSQIGEGRCIRDDVNVLCSVGCVNTGHAKESEGLNVWTVLG